MKIQNPTLSHGLFGALSKDLAPGAAQRSGAGHHWLSVAARLKKGFVVWLVG